MATAPVTPSPGKAKGTRIQVFVGVYTSKAKKRPDGTKTTPGPRNLTVFMDPEAANVLGLEPATAAQASRVEGEKEFNYRGVRNGRTAFVAHPLGVKTKGGQGKGPAKIQMMIPKGLSRKQLREAFAGKPKIKAMTIVGGIPLSFS